VVPIYKRIIDEKKPIFRRGGKREVFAREEQEIGTEKEEGVVLNHLLRSRIPMEEEFHITRRNYCKKTPGSERKR